MDKIPMIAWYVLFAIVSVVAIVCVIWCICCCRRKRPSKHSGQSDSDVSCSMELINQVPQKTIMDLPFDVTLELPTTNLKVGRRVNRGTFSAVFKAKAVGVINEQETTTVAVKRAIEPTADVNLKLLLKEVKIMMHIGKHMNIVNLVGVVHDNLVNPHLLLVVTEFCEHGDLNKFVTRNRTFFVNQVDKTDRINSSIQSIQGQVIKALNSNNASSCNSVYIGDNDLSIHESFHTITTTDLVSWSFQVAKGMEYLAKCGFLHCDVAARNVLLCNNRTVKICDFRLSQWTQSDEKYDDELSGPVPVKWFALESIRDMVFNTSTDVWSFGVLMWELFSLIAMPYDGIENLVGHLENGNRLPQPIYASLNIFEIMTSCWRKSATLRPSFMQISNALAKHLPAEVKQEIIDQTQTYLENSNRIPNDKINAPSALITDLDDAEDIGTAPEPPSRQALHTNLYENLPKTKVAQSKRFRN